VRSRNPELARRGLVLRKERPLIEAITYLVVILSVVVFVRVVALAFD
jgi:hypothetical protein